MTTASGLVLPVGMLLALLVVFVPLPPVVIDLLLVANITVSVLILLATIFVRTPLEFNVFPTVILATTLGRLVLNVATTRQILSSAPQLGLDAAGGLIRGFGEFVTGNQMVVGIVIFSILLLIQYVVITQGAGRISEVAARFALDGMPGRQMSIDADLNAGVIDQHEALRRRDELTQQADFYGAMDGASKFVKGDAIAGLAITMVNIVGGLYLGIVVNHMTVVESTLVFTKLTIGDGLASQIPAFLIALAAAMLMTRSTRRTELPVEFVRQLVAHPAGLIFAAFFLGLLSLTKLPTVPLMALGAGCLGIAYVLHWPGRAVDEDEDEEESSGAAPLERTDGKRIEDYLSVEPLEVEIGVGLIDLADPQRGGDLMQRVTSLRRRVASERGIVLPKVRIRDNLRLPEVGYRILIHGNPIGRGVLETDRWLAIAKNATAESLDGEETRDPASGERAYWITNSQREYAESHEYRVESPSAVLIEHLHRIANQHADELLSRETTRQLIDEVRQASPTVVEEVISDTLKLGDVQRVLQRLLREGVPIRPLVGILEALADVSRHTHDLDEMVEHTRACLARTITQQYRDSQGRVYAASLDSQLEQQWVDLGRAGSDATSVPLDQEQLHVLVGELGQLMATLRIAGRPEVLLVHPAIRRRVRDVVTPHLPNLRVVSHSELTSDTTVRSVGVARAKLRSRS